jgi:galactose-1-phosphate uridylyltransferase
MVHIGIVPVMRLMVLDIKVREELSVIARVLVNEDKVVYVEVSDNSNNKVLWEEEVPVMALLSGISRVLV